MNRPPSTAENASLSDTWHYQTEHAMLAPFGEATLKHFPEDFLVSLYLRARDQGLLELVFPGVLPLSLNRFICHLTDKPVVVGLDKASYNTAGIGWLYGQEGQEGYRKASFGFLFFREYQGTPIVRSIARLALKFWFCSLGVSALYGTTLKTNGLARNFGRKLGFEQLCDLPRFFAQGDQMLDASLMYLSKERFLARGASELRSKQRTGSSAK